MRNDVSNRIVVSEKKVDQAQRRGENQSANRNSRLPRALDQQRMPRNDGGDSADKRVNRAHKSQNQREGAKYIHAVLALLRKFYAVRSLRLH